MQLLINDTTITLPTTPHDVTLGERIDFYEMHGKALEVLLESILTMEEEAQEVEFMAWHTERMYCLFSFFSGVPVEVLRVSAYQDELATIYFSFLKDVFDDTEAAAPFQFEGAEWFLYEPVLRQGGPITFGEFIDAKQSMQDVAASGGSKMDHLHPLCAVFLKKKVSATTSLFYSKEVKGSHACAAYLCHTQPLQAGFSMS